MDKNMNHDFYFKQLLSNLFPDFIQLFFPEIFDYLDPASFIPLDKELLGDPDLQQVHLADLVMKAKFKHSDEFCLVHVEIQSQPQSDFPARFYKYCSKLEVKYSSKAAVKLECLTLLKEINRDDNTNRLASWFIDGYLVLTPEEEQEYELLRDSLKPEVKEVVMKMETSWSRKGREEGLQEGLKVGLQQGRKQGHEQGLQQGRKLGLEQGREQGMVMLLERQLNLRFSDISPEVIAQIHKLDSENLLRLGVAVPDFKAQSDLVEWLSKQRI